MRKVIRHGTPWIRCLGLITLLLFAVMFVNIDIAHAEDVGASSNGEHDYTVRFYKDGSAVRYKPTDSKTTPMTTDELEDLGIEWDGAVMKLHNVDFKTSAEKGIVIDSCSKDTCKVILEGSNTITVSGSNTRSQQADTYSAAKIAGFFCKVNMAFVGNDPSDTLTVLAPRVINGISVYSDSGSHYLSARNCTVQAAGHEFGFTVDTDISAASYYGSKDYTTDFSNLEPAEKTTEYYNETFSVNGDYCKTAKIVADENPYYMYFSDDRTVTWKNSLDESVSDVDPTEAKEKYGISWAFTPDGTQCDVYLDNANFQTTAKHALYFDGFERAIIRPEGENNVIAARGSDKTNGSAIYCDDGILRFDGLGTLNVLAPHQDNAIYDTNDAIQIWKGVLNASCGGDDGAILSDSYIYYGLGDEEDGKLLDKTEVLADDAYTEDFSTVASQAYLNNSAGDPVICTDSECNNPAKAVTIKCTYLVYMGSGGLDQYGNKRSYQYYDKYADATVEKNPFSKDDYVFVEWNTKGDGTGTSYQPGDTFKFQRYTVLYAIWGAIVHFDANVADPSEVSGSMDDIKIASERWEYLGENTFERQGYTFQHWNTKADDTGDSYLDGEYVQLDWRGEHTLYAIWKANEYTISFDANGGQGTMSDLGAKYDADVQLTKSAFTRDGYIFSGWNDKADGTGTNYEDGASVSNLTSANGGNVTLYAVWKEIPPIDVTNDEKLVITDIPDQTYTGTINPENGQFEPKVHKPELSITYDGNALSEGTDYTVKYSNNIDAAAKDADKAPTATVTFKGAYTGTVSRTFTINKGTSTPYLRMAVNNRFLGEGDALESTYGDTLTFMSGISEEPDGGSFDVSILIDGTAYDTEFDSLNGYYAISKTDLSVGDHTAKAALTNNSNWQDTETEEISFVVKSTDPEPKPATDVTDDEKLIIADIPDQTYGGTRDQESGKFEAKAHKPELTITYDGKELAEGTDYTVGYSNNIDAAAKDAEKAPTATVTFIGDYTGTVSKTFTINKGIATPFIRMAVNDQFLDEDATRESTYGDKVTFAAGINEDPDAQMDVSILIDNEAVAAEYDSDIGDYIITSTDIAAGTHTAKATLVNSSNWQDAESVEISFTVQSKSDPEPVGPTTPKELGSMALSTSTYTYNGAVKTPGVTVKGSEGSTLTKNTDYKVTYASGRKAIGTYKVTVTGMGDYTGTLSKSFKITPAKVSILTPKAGVKKVTVKWKKSGGGVYYKVGYKLKTSKTWKYTTSKTTSKTIKKLKSKKYYNVKVRAYKKVGTTTYYGAWSKTKTVKIK